MDIGAAMFELGFAYSEACDNENMLKYYRQSAEMGNSSAMNFLGLAYQYGEGVQKSEEEALRWFRMSAEKGNCFAEFNLGEHYEKLGNLTEALKYYKSAAEKARPREFSQ